MFGWLRRLFSAPELPAIGSRWRLRTNDGNDYVVTVVQHDVDDWVRAQLDGEPEDFLLHLPGRRWSWYFVEVE